MGETLDPEHVSRILGCQPTRAEKKGEVYASRNRKFERIARAGIWTLEANEKEPADLDLQVNEILSQLPCDLSIWHALSKKFELDLFCGFFMEKSNEGIDISPSSLEQLGARGIALALDIYDGGD